MGFTRRRPGKDGRVGYQALYDDARGVRQTAGTFTTRKAADKAWQRAEARIAEGKPGDPRRGKQTFRTYVEDRWLPNHRMEATTRQDYVYAIKAHIMPYFADMKMRDITSETVREWITHLKQNGVSAHRIKYCKTSILNAIFTTAVNDGVIIYHPSRGVATDPVPEKPRRTITPEQFDLIYNALPDADAQLLVETDIESGLRWGELTELRVKDLDTRTRVLTVSRAVVELVPEYHPEGKRFLVKEYPKDKRTRRFKLSPQITTKLKAHIEAQNLTSNDLLFARRHTPPKPPLHLVEPTDPTFTAPNGRTYAHGTITAYNLGKCKCDHCRGAYAAYRASRRAKGKDNPRKPRVVDTDPHISANWFRKHCWHPARDAAALDWSPRIHDLRHAHASWLLAGGADLQVVKERLGHRKISTTERYLHTLPTADETALEALNKIRNTFAITDLDLQGQLQEAQAKIAQLQAALADQLLVERANPTRNLRSL
ncbi:tyrosine-type recombinase/integrase [Actinomadura macrotermitis]|uniref:Tyrosine recombinase XerC n=1 Tax=Actinomadura macrotermitis TaxID=2585200 RepID=A0A7K0BYJ2_9ACTN|nr:tyrosine-type recombinase/integrase [Actinomadura macrotermitis]MQY06249.1 Tyrosine recombinase XerC [Actinomadura macrotermitis]